jgi:pimeloyl-ACP methyl ester carboxylesterase
LVVGLSPPGTPLSSEDEIRKMTQPLVAGNDLKALAAFNRVRGGIVVSDDQLRAARVPTLGIIGSADPSANSMRELETVMPVLKVVIVDGAEHGGERGILRRKEFLPSVREFLAAAR